MQVLAQLVLEPVVDVDLAQAVGGGGAAGREGEGHEREPERETRARWYGAPTLVKGVWFDVEDGQRTGVTVLTRRKMAMSFATGLRESTFHERFARGVALARAGQAIPSELELARRSPSARSRNEFAGPSVRRATRERRGLHSPCR